MKKPKNIKLAVVLFGWLLIAVPNLHCAAPAESTTDLEAVGLSSRIDRYVAQDMTGCDALAHMAESYGFKVIFGPGVRKSDAPLAVVYSNTTAGQVVNAICECMNWYASYQTDNWVHVERWKTAKLAVDPGMSTSEWVRLESGLRKLLRDGDIFDADRSSQLVVVSVSPQTLGEIKHFLAAATSKAGKSRIRANP